MSIELIIPPLGESISEAVVAKWLKPVGALVKVDDPLAELETDKVTVTLPAPSAGVLVEQLVPVGTSVRVGSSIGRIDPTAQPSQVQPSTTEPAKKPTPVEPAKAAVPSPAPAPVAAPLPAAAPAPSPPARPQLTPNTRKLLREQGVDPSTAAASVQVAPPRAKAAPAPAVPSSAGPEEVVTLSSLRKRIAERLVEAQHTAAILTTFNEVDMSYIMALRSKFQDEFVKKHGIKLGLMSFFVKACVEALREFPGLNAEMRGDAIAYKKFYDFGIAVGSGKGLVVPVLRGVDKLGLADIEKGIAELAQKAKENKLQLSDLAGGTFSISNGGVYGSMMSTPLLNMPQTGILGMHNIIRRPIAVGDNIEIRPMMYVALSYDHRVVDGREAVSFLVRVKERLESPEKFLLGI
ncbi:MAG TPA: 2-oxoglutarate dehydrogenase complex dihydrolipoyllysine-residue succinyltransferase [Pseudomonadota bacterium]|nr:2-oxoglutarate dehydrogenase complex dihydrolipoyllysine-residue succinyltransferase [Pseudomonadota bacterium]HNO68794.1 2-oxoglutarate dehydrogenase complex dihydrolipoyllysine-residue succinyltransferase [Pseudomonadota bacterium]